MVQRALRTYQGAQQKDNFELSYSPRVHVHARTTIRTSRNVVAHLTDIRKAHDGLGANVSQSAQFTPPYCVHEDAPTTSFGAFNQAIAPVNNVYQYVYPPIYLLAVMGPVESLARRVFSGLHNISIPPCSLADAWLIVPASIRWCSFFGFSEVRRQGVRRGRVLNSAEFHTMSRLPVKELLVLHQYDPSSRNYVNSLPLV